MKTAKIKALSIRSQNQTVLKPMSFFYKRSAILGLGFFFFFKRNQNVKILNPPNINKKLRMNMSRQQIEILTVFI